MVRALLLLLSLLAGSNDGAGAQERPLRIGVREAAPFALQRPDGSWEGISIELWEAIARDLGYHFELREVSTLPELLEGVSNGALDAALGALTITSQREDRLDFSHPFHVTGLSIAVPMEAQSGWISVLHRFLSPEFLRVILALVLVLLAVGALVWLFERHRNPEQFGGGSLRGIGAGFWWSAVTLTTVGYGDKAPQTLGGRLVALVWMFTGLILISSFTAAITSTLTLGELSGPVQGPQDLPRVRVGTVSASTSAAFLESSRISARSFAGPDSALNALRRGEVDAVVYDAPILQYLALTQHRGEIRVLPTTFERQFYGIALPPGSPLREPVSRVLLARIDDPEWQRILFRYLGE